jgi:very-short-patch-repair endonuclease
VPIGHYIVDFLAPSIRLVVEVDGAYHAGRERADSRRERELTRAGYRVLRLEAELVLQELPRALEKIREVIGGR